MKKLEDFSVRMNDESWITVAQASVLLECSIASFHNTHQDRLRTVKFAGVNFVNLEELITYNNHRLYMKALKERKNNTKNEENE